jgi:hypothetical protein
MSNRKIQRHNTRSLQKEMVSNLSKSEMWLVLRLDKDGTHLHMPNEDHMAMFGIFFSGHPEILEMVNAFVKETKK